MDAIALGRTQLDRLAKLAIAALLALVAGCGPGKQAGTPTCEEILNGPLPSAGSAVPDHEWLGARRIRTDIAKRGGVPELRRSIRIGRSDVEILIEMAGLPTVRVGQDGPFHGYPQSPLDALRPKVPLQAEYALIRRAGAVYLLALSDGRPIFLDRVHPSTVERLCDFGLKRNALLRRGADRDAALCGRLSTNRPIEMRLKGPPITPEQAELIADLGVNVRSLTALADIDNDGTPNLVAQAQQRTDDPVLRGRVFPVVLDPDRAGESAAQLNRRIIALADGDGAHKVVPFVDGDRVLLYSEALSFHANGDSEVQRRIYKLSTDGQVLLCDLLIGPAYATLGAWDMLTSVPPGASRVGSLDAAFTVGWKRLLAMEGTAALEELLRRGEIPLEDGRGRTFLAAAADVGRIDVLRALLAAGADPNFTGIDDMGQQALPIAIERDNLEAVELLLAHGTDPNGAALTAAVTRGSAKGLLLLLKAGARRTILADCDVACYAQRLDASDEKLSILREYFPDLEFGEPDCPTGSAPGICMPEDRRSKR